jgi:quercetin 2,3-dioxygenase
MIRIRKSAERGSFDFGWLLTRHSFSFGNYHDPNHMGFQALRVINEDRVAPGEGFPPHPHRDMEIVTYVLEGGLEHRDSTGSHGVIPAGAIQRMSAGTGVTHSEFNASKTDPVHFLQIWILPSKRNLTPTYEQKEFSARDRKDRLLSVFTPDGREGTAVVHQDATLYICELSEGKALEHAIAPGRHAWVQAVSGAFTVNQTPLSAGDGAAISEERAITLKAQAPSHLLLFDLGSF